MTPSRPKVYAIDGVIPVVAPTAFVHPAAVLIGDVIVEDGCYIGPCASLRGDFGRIIVRRGSNVQDSCTLHGMPGYDSIIGENGHIGHGAIIHSASLGANVLVGMNAVIMDHAVIGDSAIVAAMSFVKARSEIPARSLAAGVPAKVIRALTDDDMAMKAEGTRKYQELVQRSLATLVATEALTDFDESRPRVDASIIMPVRERIKGG